MNKIKLLHIIPTLRFGGAERFVIDLVNHLDKDVYEPHILLFKDDQPLAHELKKHVTVHIAEKTGKLGLDLFGKLGDIIEKIEPDIVHTNLFGGDVWGRIVAHRRGIPVFTTEHNINVSEGWLKHRVKQLLNDYSDEYSCPSQAIASYMQEEYGAPDNIHVIRYGIDLNRFTSIKREVKLSRPRILLLGRLVKQKGHITALQALAHLKNYDWQLDVVGSGEEESWLRQMVADLELSDRVHFHGATADTPTAYKRADIVLVPSHWEGLGMVVMEAMASERVVIASKTGGIPEMIDHKKNGLLVEPQHVDDLKDALVWTFENQKAALLLAKAARKKARAEFGMETMVNKYDELYKAMVE